VNYKHLLFALLLFLDTSLVEASSPDAQLGDAVQAGDLEQVRDAFSAGARCNTRNTSRVLFTAIEAQSGFHYWEVIEELVQHGVLLEQYDYDGNSPFMLLVRGAREPSFPIKFLEFKPDLQHLNKNGESVVSLACQRPWPDLFMALLKAGAPPDTANKNGFTPLMEAAKGSGVFVQALLDHKADPERKDQSGKTAADYAFEARNYDALILLDVSKKYESHYAEILQDQKNKQLADAVFQHN
jgi:uncharacterized protein